MADSPTIRVMALHALAYCERLFFLEEVEEIRVADERVYAGRALHEAVPESGPFVELVMESEALGIRGRVDGVRRWDGVLLPYEHKRGHCKRVEGKPHPWPSDRIQVGAYALLLEETRKALDEDRAVSRLFPRDDARRSLHIVGHGARIGRSGDRLVITPRDGEVTRTPIREVRSVAIHGYSSASAQALRLCSDHGVAVHWFSKGGWYVGTFLSDDLAVQRRIRQYEALREPAFRLSLARRLVAARAEGQLRFLLRATRGTDRDASGVAAAIASIRKVLPAVHRAEAPATLLGLEGQAAKAYFDGLGATLGDDVDPSLRPAGRSRRPPKDRFNAMLSFGYALLLREVVQAIRTVGLDGAFGLYHQPRSAAPPLALDLIELFRVPCVDMAVVGAVNRSQLDVEADFQIAGRQVWLSDTGRKKMITVFERRLADAWRHPLLEYSLSYRRHIELEVRLLEKEWSGEAGQFARTRIR